jgi:hypothetical protein
MARPNERQGDHDIIILATSLSLSFDPTLLWVHMVVCWAVWMLKEDYSNDLPHRLYLRRSFQGFPGFFPVVLTTGERS